VAWRTVRGIIRDSAFPGNASVIHGITTRPLGDQKSAPNRRCPSGVRAFVLAEQVHGARIAWIGERFPRQFIPRTDGLFTREPGLALGIFTADCVPVLFSWPEESIVGVVHAGWRGLSAGIIGKACRALLRWAGKKTLRGLRVAIGPHIRSCCYEVSEDVARVFSKPGIAFRDGSRWYVHLAGEVKRQLSEGGLDPRDFSEAPFCTKEDRRFFSYRRDQDSRRILTYIFQK